MDKCENKIIIDHMNNVYYSHNPLVRYIHLKRINTIKSLISENAGKILDCGCGGGHLLKLLNGEKYGIDKNNIDLIETQKRNPNAVLFCGDITCMPFNDNTFDIVICSEVLEHIYNYDKAICEIMRVCKNGGIIIITVPNEINWTIGRLFTLRFPIKLKEHINSFTPNKIKKLFLNKPCDSIFIPFNSFAFALTQIHLIKNVK